MTVEKQLKNCLLLYPTIFRNRWDVYHHWFIVNGNGYEWVEGELVSMTETEESTIETAIQRHHCYLGARIASNDLIDKYLGNKYFEKECHNNTLASLDWENRSKIFVAIGEVYPLCQYAKILNIPKNIKPDWKEAVLKMYEWQKGNYDIMGEKNRKWMDKIEAVSNNLI